MLIIIIIIITTTTTTTIKFLFNNAQSQHKGGCTLRVSLPVLQPHIFQYCGPIFTSTVDPYLPVLWPHQVDDLKSTNILQFPFHINCAKSLHLAVQWN
jgi:hypothetical protein